MQLWSFELERLGFRKQSDRYWRCAARFGLPEGARLSIFTGLHKAIWGPASRDAPPWLELDAFHVTFLLPRDHVHFYYREGDINRWAPEGYTPAAQVVRMGGDPMLLREVADVIAERFVAALDGDWQAR